MGLARASPRMHAVVGIDSESREMVADDNRRASDNLATRDYPSLQIVMPGPGWRISCSYHRLGRVYM